MTLRLAVVALLAVALAGCYREKREFQSPPPASPADPVKTSELRPATAPPCSPVRSRLRIDRTSTRTRMP